MHLDPDIGEGQLEKCFGQACLVKVIKNHLLKRHYKKYNNMHDIDTYRNDEKIKQKELKFSIHISCGFQIFLIFGGEKFAKIGIIICKIKANFFSE